MNNAFEVRKGTIDFVSPVNNKTPAENLHGLSRLEMIESELAHQKMIGS